jgi:tetratricopeptide (TPR) repeat protein
MPFVRRKKNQLLVVHNTRTPEGKVKQQVLHTFPSPADLEETLTRGWSAWCKDMKWRFPEPRWNWTWLQIQLREALEQWVSEEPSGALARRESRLSKVLDELNTTLGRLSRARPEDTRALERLDPALRQVREKLGRVLDPPTGPTAAVPANGHVLDAGDKEEADMEFDEGMEHWWDGDRTAACRYFRKAVKIDPLHSEANNHLGIYLMESGRFKDAEQHFERAIEGGERNIRREHGLVAWGWLENRPYLRALGNLALLRRRQKRYQEALDIWERLLTLNPNDNQGVRYLLGEGYHRLGQLEDALAAYERGIDEPGGCYSRALLFHQMGRTEKVGTALVLAFAGNRYVPPMLLGERWERVDGFHWTGAAEPEWAAEYVNEQGDLWRKVPGSADLLRHWWHAEPVREWMARIDELTVRLGHLEPGDERNMVVAEHSGLVSVEMARIVAAKVDPRAEGRARTHKKPHVASLDEVRIRREPDGAVIEYADENVETTHLVLRNKAESMTDEEILELHNEIIETREEMRHEYEHVAVEVPLGRPQIDFSPTSRQWGARGDVIRALIEDEEGGQVKIIIDDVALSIEEFGRLLVTHAGWGMRLVFVPDDEIHLQPEIVVQEPEER